MKKLIFMAIVTAVIFTHCNKASDTIVTGSSRTYLPKHLIANAGADTTICMPYGGKHNIFKAVLNGRASRDDAGTILSYTWSEIVSEGAPSPQAQITDPSKDSTPIIFHSGSGLHVFNLEVRDDQGRVDFARISVYVISQFDYAYDNLSWDSTTSGLATISVNYKPGVMETWPAGSYRYVFFKNFKGCYDVSRWQKIPFVPYDSIRLTNKPLFYSVVLGHSNIIGSGISYTAIYANKNSGIDLQQKVSIGFTMTTPLN